MRRVSAFPSRRRSGFTLIEALLSLMLLAILLTALNSFIFSMGELWGQRRKERVFGQHVRAVSRHVEQMMLNVLRGPTRFTDTAGFRFEQTWAAQGDSTLRLSFDLMEGDSIETDPALRLPDQVATIGYERDAGLVLLWQSRIETRYGKDQPHRAVISPFVTAVFFDYYDDTFGRWQTLDTPPKDTDGNYTVPGRIRFQFKYDGITRETWVTIPDAIDSHVPRF